MNPKIVGGLRNASKHIIVSINLLPKMWKKSATCIVRHMNQLVPIWLSSFMLTRRRLVGLLRVRGIPLGHTETFIDGVWFPSVTTVMHAAPKPWLQKWREKWGALAERKTKLAGLVGNEFHSCVEQYLDTGTFAISDGSDGFPVSCTMRVASMMNSWILWAESVEGVIEATELKVISRLHVFSGTLDAVGTFNGKRMIIDWKTSSRIYDEMALQLSAYAQAYKEQQKVDIKQGLIVHVSKDKPRYKVTVKEFKLGKRVFNKFLKLRAMFDEMRDECAPTTQENTI
jgi:hypothetical protein